MSIQNRRASDSMGIPSKGTICNRDHEHIRQGLEKCMAKEGSKYKMQEDRTKATKSLLECTRMFLDCEFYNPLPQLIRRFIKTITLQTKRRGRRSNVTRRTTTN